MTPSNTKYQQLLENLDILKLETMKDYLPNYIEALNKREITFIESLTELTKKRD